MGVLASVSILLLMRKDKLHAHHGAFWVVIAICFALLGFAPGFFDWLARVFGIGYPPVLALAAAIMLIVLKLLMVDLDHAALKLRNERLIQHNAILELELRKLREELRERDGEGEAGSGTPPNAD